ncbi:ROK family protein [Paenibacillus sp. PAMC21692]|uniref:ROK family protein n=1 Tax=Paenibacillus sp. PAMC21692 TaxID=2762320 RepID=UPI00164DCE00|nr:ROK family protein [Paenibacillus sp. PAMC21692]QNK56210.1 ROK family protein [Paenibacillus sp. PAMC21692]
MNNIAVGIDIGGTKIAIGLIAENGEVIAKSSLKTDLSLEPGEMLGQVADVVNKLANEQGLALNQLKGIGVGAPGPLNTKTGRLTCPPNLKSWWDFPVVERLAELLPLPIRMENDATAATLAEKWVGAAQDADHFIFITISTGIGAGIYLHGKLITGSTGNAGDAGFLIVHPQGPIAKDQASGFWELLASGTAIAKQASELLGKEITSKEAFDLAAQGDPVISPLIEKVYTYIGMGCVSLINLLDPSKIVIGGGVSQVGEPLFTAVRSYVAAHALNPSGRETVIVPAKLRQDAGLIGAAALVHCNY